MNIKNNKNRKAANCFAVIISFIPNHVLKIPEVKVGTAKCSTAPKSDSVSIATNIIPAITAGRAKGRATFKKVLLFDKPKVLEISKISLDWLRKAVLEIKKTYG